jgi:hypothetical protein
LEPRGLLRSLRSGCDGSSRKRRRSTYVDREWRELVHENAQCRGG